MDKYAYRYIQRPCNVTLEVLLEVGSSNIHNLFIDNCIIKDMRVRDVSSYHPPRCNPEILVALKQNQYLGTVLKLPKTAEGCS